VWPVDHNVDVVFIGSGGRLLSTQKAVSAETGASYRIEGSEGYVRARIVRADGKVAWTPAVRVQRSGVARTIANEPPPIARTPG
jgi:hypothetical protein